MLVEHVKAGENVGPELRRRIQLLHDTMKAKNDDSVIAIVGLTGSGKSNLGLHIYDIVIPDQDKQDVKFVALAREDFANGLADASKQPRGERFIQYDEGKQNRRRWQDEWNRDLLEIYHDIRGLNIFHVWCTAMPDLLDRQFVSERVKGLLFIPDKEQGARRVLYLTKDDLLKFMDANKGKLSTPLLKKHGKKFADLQSEFRPYTGPMLKAYLDKKEDRSITLLENFKKRWGTGGKTLQEVSVSTGKGYAALYKDFRNRVDRGEALEGIDYVKVPTGVLITPKGEELLAQTRRGLLVSRGKVNQRKAVRNTTNIMMRDLPEIEAVN